MSSPSDETNNRGPVCYRRAHVLKELTTTEENCMCPDSVEIGNNFFYHQLPTPFRIRAFELFSVFHHVNLVPNPHTALRKREIEMLPTLGSKSSRLDNRYSVAASFPLGKRPDTPGKGCHWDMQVANTKNHLETKTHSLAKMMTVVMLLLSASLPPSCPVLFFFL